MERINIIAIFGESASGKDTLQKELCKSTKYHKIISTTTRPKRQHEVEGIDYYFVSAEDFAKKVMNLEMLEATQFNDWFYGTTLSALDKDIINVGVFNPQGIRCLLDDERLNIIPIYIASSPKTRLLRSLNREDNPDVDEIIRRYGVDKKDFLDTVSEFDAYIFDNGELEEDMQTLGNRFKSFVENLSNFD